MKLKYLWVEKYKNLENFDCYFSDNRWDILISTNGSGKSNILEVISQIFFGLYMEVTPKINFNFKIRYITNNKEIAFTNVGYNGIVKIYDCDIATSEYKIARHEYLPRNLIALYSGESTRLFESGFKNMQYKYNSAYFRTSALNIFTSQMFYNTYKQWNIFAFLLNIYNIESEFDEDLKSANCKSILKANFKFNTKNQMRNKNVFVGGLLSKLNPEIKEEVTFFGDDLRTLFLQLIQYDRSELFCLLNIAINSDRYAIISDMSLCFENQLELPQLSEGEKKYISLLGTYLLMDSDETLILLDEPDVHLHETRKHMLSKLIKERSAGQTLLTTHSSVFINDFELGSEIILSTVNGITKITDRDKTNALLSISGGKETITALNSLLESKKTVLLLEGQTDVKYVQKVICMFAAQDDKYKKLDYDIMSFNGTGNAAFFIANFQKLASNRKLICVFDRDKAGVDALNKITGKNFSKSNNNINVVNGRLSVFLYPPAYGKKSENDFLLEDYFDDRYVQTIVDAYITSKFSVRFRSVPSLDSEIKNKIESEFENGTIPDYAFNGFKVLLDKLLEANKRFT